MARLRFLTVALLALALTGNSIQTGKTAAQGWSNPQPASGLTTEEKRTCVIYPLSDMGYDADLGKWMAETIPEVIEPESWKSSAALRYYAPKNILIVHHFSSVQTKVDAFLKKMKSSLPKGRESDAAANKTSSRDVVFPAAYRAPAAFQTSGLPEPSSYPVPAPVKAPKHLFHFLIRYEGEGIIDDNVVRFMKVQNQAEKKDKGDKEASDPVIGLHAPKAP